MRTIYIIHIKMKMDLTKTIIKFIETSFNY